MSSLLVVKPDVAAVPGPDWLGPARLERCEPPDGQAPFPRRLHSTRDHRPAPSTVGQLLRGALRGDSAHTLTWHGAEWLFSSAENRALFEAEPERYAPEFGGFCAYASSKGFTTSVDPTAFRVEGGKLYLFNDASMRDKWIAELPEGVIGKATERWKVRQ